MKKKYLLVASAGGHLTEIIESLPMDFSWDDAVLMTYRTSLISGYLCDTKFIVNPHLSYWKYFICAIQTLIGLIVVRPKVIISTGAGIAVPCIFLSKYFKAKLIFIESAANIHQPSRTGCFAYRYANLFIIQYPSLKKFYPKAVVGRLL